MDFYWATNFSLSVEMVLERESDGSAGVIGVCPFGRFVI